MGVLKYTSKNGYTGILYGKSSLSIIAKDGIEVLHTKERKINTAQELIDFVDSFDLVVKMIFEDAIRNRFFEDEEEDAC